MHAGRTRPFGPDLLAAYRPCAPDRPRCPVRLVLGDPAAGSVIDEATARARVAATPCLVTVVRLGGVGHAVCREARDRFAEELTGFADGLAPSGGAFTP